ncbi:Hypothetical predicted protein, partial [Pelobates cultripes]
GVSTKKKTSRGSVPYTSQDAKRPVLLEPAHLLMRPMGLVHQRGPHGETVPDGWAKVPVQERLYIRPVDQSQPRCFHRTTDPGQARTF